VALAQQFNANIGLTLFYGIVIAIPTIIIAGPIFSVTLKKYTSKPLAIFSSASIPDHELPSMLSSLSAAFLPVVLIGLDTIISLTVPTKNTLTAFIHIIGDPSVAMLISLLMALYTLGIAQGKKIKFIMGPIGDSVKEVSSILLIIAGAGALKQILLDTGMSTELIKPLTNLSLHPLFLAWLIAAILRVSIGSATVAGLTTAGIVAPLIASSGVNPSLMVLATGAGSVFFSHVNDPGFWMFKEYFNLTVKETFKTWSTMETIVSVAGLVGVFIVNYFI
jgi:Gnt-I system high-affinity gluconate transporter